MFVYADMFVLRAVQDALHKVSTNVFKRLAMPDWLLRLGPTQAVRDVRQSFDELEVRFSPTCPL